MPESYEDVERSTAAIVGQWLASCKRRGRTSRNTFAVGMVVLDHLIKKCPVARDEVISEGGEIKGSRAGLGKLLASYGLGSLKNPYLKEATTRQVHQDGQRLFDALEWGRSLAHLSEDERGRLLQAMIGKLKTEGEAQVKERLQPDLDRNDAPHTWVELILESAKGRSGGVVEQHLVGAKLEKRFPEDAVPNFPAHAADVQTDRAGDYTLGTTVYHVTGSPTRSVVQKCGANLRDRLHPILLVPRSAQGKAIALAEDERIYHKMSIMSIEDFLALNIVELAAGDAGHFFDILREIIQIYNTRLSEVETDLSLRIEVR